MLAEIARETGIEQVDAAAISLSSEFLARAASEHPERFRTLTLITPTGFRKGAKQYGKSGSTRAVPFVREFFSFPLWGRPFFDLLNSAPSQRYFLMKTFGSYEAIDEGLLNYDALTAHQPGAQHAPFAFVSGTLFSADIDRVYDTLNMPVWVAYGTRGDFSKVDPKKAAARANWTARSFPTGALPHFEQPEQFCAAYDAFLQGSSA
jgi:pimeloyl-ACP methyl ester carboxylesterase